jgi:hypothetical protein
MCGGWDFTTASIKHMLLISDPEQSKYMWTVLFEPQEKMPRLILPARLRYWIQLRGIFLKLEYTKQRLRAVRVSWSSSSGSHTDQSGKTRLIYLRCWAEVTNSVRRAGATIWHCPIDRVFKDRQDGHHRAKFETQIAS